MFGVGTLIILFVGLTLLVPSYLPLYFQRTDLERALAIEEEALNKIDKARINAMGDKVAKLIASVRDTAEHPEKVSLLYTILTPQLPGIAISSFSVTKEGDVSLGGNAATRRDLLNLEQNLRDSGRFQEIVSPLNNVIRETNITFAIKAKLKLPYRL